MNQHANQTGAPRLTLIEKLRQKWAEEFGDSTNVYFAISRPEESVKGKKRVTTVYPKHYDKTLVNQEKLNQFAKSMSNAGLNIIV